MTETEKTRIEERVRFMEEKRGRNHPLDQFHGWLDQEIPGWKTGRVIQVIGTNGKGSTSIMMAETLKRRGLRVGLFTSPHILEHFERIRINGDPIPAEEWMKIYEKWEPLFEDERFTMFEIDLFMALAWFVKNQCDVLILEAGMGGEFDATSAVDKDLLVYTQTGLDHMAFLGDTLEKIAASKAGAFRKDVPVVCGEKNPKIQDILRQRARQAGCSIDFVVNPDEVSSFQENLKNRNPHAVKDLPAYQMENALLAWNALKKLDPKITLHDFAQALTSFFWPCRFQQVSDSPRIVIDGAHNLAGVQALVTSISPGEFKRCYFSVLADKQGREMIELLKTKVDQIILVHFDSYRLADLEKLAKETDLKVISLDELERELKTLQESALVCGSLYFAAEVLKFFTDDPSKTDLIQVE